MKKEQNELTLDNCPDILNVEEVAKVFHVTVRTIYYLTESCQLDSFRVGRARRYTKSSLYRYVYEQTGDEKYNPRVLNNNPMAFLQTKASSEIEAMM